MLYQLSYLGAEAPRRRGRRFIGRRSRLVQRVSIALAPRSRGAGGGHPRARMGDSPASSPRPEADHDPASPSAAAALALATPPLRPSLPKHVGDCATTKVSADRDAAGRRLDHKPDRGFGQRVEFVNGGYQVSYDTVAAIEASRPGDPVHICLVSIPQGLPAGRQSRPDLQDHQPAHHGLWTLPDAEHSCGGA